MAVFGSGLIAMRLPQILAFWIMCLCLFTFVNRRAGVLAGSTAMAVPLITGAYFYAYEARPHGLVLGCCGLALLCWDRVERKRTGVLWLVAFSLCLEAAFLIHCYAVLIAAPFALVEAVRTVRSRRLNWRVWVALATPAVIAAISFVPLLRSYKTNLQNTGFDNTFRASFGQLLVFYEALLRPMVLVVVLILILFASGRASFKSRRTEWEDSWTAAPALLLAAGFLGMPLYGLLLARVLHGPFVQRYFMAATIGVSAAIGIGVGVRAQNKLIRFIPALVVLLLARDISKLLWDRVHGSGGYLIEPSSNTVIDTAPRDDLATHPLLKQSPSGLPIAIPDILDFLYLEHYWPTERSRLVQIVASETASDYTITEPLHKWCHLDFKEASYDQFFKEHQDFLLYSPPRFEVLLSRLIARGAQIRSLKFEGTDHFLAEIHMPDQNQAAH